MAREIGQDVKDVLIEALRPGEGPDTVERGRPQPNLPHGLQRQHRLLPSIDW
ncbi:hypothetical protein [Streptomyces sp. AM8-1-1]|uniref:hypothetical protein n=1 Tax=Streptomyces sp. AM8-1-1 TaxID=3075825 RepID=UPI0028C4CE8E|nr:hypothetical protein [Streptomyces sp. AM8-1-1]WNO76884.1 hypothetical protein RPQ07_37045 [Streptomyces sp. AM8-1-1]